MWNDWELKCHPHPLCVSCAFHFIYISRICEKILFPSSPLLAFMGVLWCFPLPGLDVCMQMLCVSAIFSPSVIVTFYKFWQILMIILNFIKMAAHNADLTVDDADVCDAVVLCFLKEVLRVLFMEVVVNAVEKPSTVSITHCDIQLLQPPLLKVLSHKSKNIM